MSNQGEQLFASALRSWAFGTGKIETTMRRQFIYRNFPCPKTRHAHEVLRAWTSIQHEAAFAWSCMGPKLEDILVGCQFVTFFLAVKKGRKILGENLSPGRATGRMQKERKWADESPPSRVRSFPKRWKVAKSSMNESPPTTARRLKSCKKFYHFWNNTNFRRWGFISRKMRPALRVGERIPFDEDPHFSETLESWKKFYHFWKSTNFRPWGFINRKTL